MVNLEYYNGKEWVPAGGPFGNDQMAWVSLGGDSLNYRTVDSETGDILTDGSHPHAWIYGPITTQCSGQDSVTPFADAKDRAGTCS